MTQGPEFIGPQGPFSPQPHGEETIQLSFDGAIQQPYGGNGPPPPPPPPPQKKTTILVVGIIVLAVLVLGGYFVYANVWGHPASQTQTPAGGPATSTPPPHGTSDKPSPFQSPSVSDTPSPSVSDTPSPSVSAPPPPPPPQPTVDPYAEYCSAYAYYVSQWDDLMNQRGQAVKNHDQTATVFVDRQQIGVFRNMSDSNPPASIQADIDTVIEYLTKALNYDLGDSTQMLNTYDDAMYMGATNRIKDNAVSVCG